ncbi:hypothetical protein [Rhodococcus gannanensis]|uniref:Uncharacterized protein n=1 Tax=Rhodococcus gannanensis TaxID=1960308 RepID=A0ABW4P1H8_9NOCA
MDSVWGSGFGALDRRAAQLVAASVAGNVAELSAFSEWLGELSADDLVRFDQRARRRWTSPDQRVQMERCWTTDVLAAHPTAAIAASVLAHGHVRERAVIVLAAQEDVSAARTLAVRACDHVDPIRRAASAAVMCRLDLDLMQVIVPVLFTLHRWNRGWRTQVFADYLAAVEEVHGIDTVWTHLMANSDVRLRRYAHEHALELGVLGVEQGVARYASERDVLVQRTLGKVVLRSADPEVVARLLLQGNSAADRAAALARFDADVLAREDLRRLLVDRSALVRLWARRRWSEVGEDPVTTYRQIVADVAQPARARALAHLGLSEGGHTPDVAKCRSLARDRAASLRAMGLRLMIGRAESVDVSWLLDRVSSGPRGESRWARAVLAAQPGLWTVTDAEPMWSAYTPETRCRAWKLCRARGGWEAVIADLRACGDTDPLLHGAGRAIRAAMAHHRQPTDDRRARVAEFLPQSGLPDSPQRDVAARAGLSFDWAVPRAS